MKHEFDEYIEHYRDTLDKAVALSGESSAFFAEYKAEKLKKWLPQYNTKDSKILDFGCGDGMMTSFVHHFFPKASVYGVDPSSDSIDFAQQYYDTIQFTVSNTTIPHEDNMFDLAYSAGVFHHIPFDEHQHYIKELVRVVKPGGRIVIFELNPLNPLTVLTFKRNPIDKNAQMMFPWYTYNLVKLHGKTKTTFYCFFPNPLRFLRPTEPYITKLPLGALYATIVQVR